MSDYSPVWPHGDILKAFENIYMVQGTNITNFNDLKIQHSRNMTIVEHKGDLALINTVRLDEARLQELDQLGTVKHVISIGAFHGRDDQFYLDKYKAKLWTVKETISNYHTTQYLSDADVLPIKNSHFYIFKNSSPLEGFIYIEDHEGIVITCDSIKNWVQIDRFFSEDTAKMALSNGEISKARISPIWLSATGVKKSDFENLMTLKFKHLISAHGDVLRDTAYEDVKKSIGAISSCN